MEVMLAPELDDKAAARRSLDLTYLDDIPEERALSGKSSEEKEITRLDSGLGEWDSESSRKTSFSSQGRLSPDFAMAKVTHEGFVVFMQSILLALINRCFRTSKKQTECAVIYPTIRTQ